MPQTPERKKKYFKEWYSENKEASRLRTKKWHEDNPDYQREYDLQRKYGIGIKDYELLLEKQAGLCAICEKECPSGRRLAVDHDPETGKIRGLLCHKCNRGLGWFSHDQELLQKALEYIYDERRNRN